MLPTASSLNNRPSSSHNRPHHFAHHAQQHEPPQAEGGAGSFEGVEVAFVSGRSTLADGEAVLFKSFALSLRSLSPRAGDYVAGRSAVEERREDAT
jgi:hypothetical protein